MTTQTVILKGKEGVQLMKPWLDWLQSLSTEGGAIFVLLILTFAAGGAWTFGGFMELKDPFLMILGGILGLLKGEQGKGKALADNNDLKIENAQLKNLITSDVDQTQK